MNFQRNRRATMTASQQREQVEGLERRKREAREALIRERVIRALGEPGDLLAVQVRRLWEDHFQVNVLVGEDAASARVANSYFLVADGDGNIIRSTPGITKQY
jgi:hypothetical protein